MSDNTSWRGGEYYDPQEENNIPRESARKLFLLAAARLYNVTADLRDRVLPYLPAADTPLTQEPVRGALLKWCERHNLAERWILQHVELTLTGWKIQPDLCLNKPNPRWHLLMHFVRRPLQAEHETPFRFEHEVEDCRIVGKRPEPFVRAAGWDVTLSRRREFEDAVKRDFLTALKSYCDEQERAALERGWKRVPYSRKRGFSDETKMQWMVHHQCGRLSYEAIADLQSREASAPPDVSTIIKSINQIRALIGLSPEGVRGRQLIL